LAKKERKKEKRKGNDGNCDEEGRRGIMAQVSIN
jgi:hypothetical protein